MDDTAAILAPPEEAPDASDTQGRLACVDLLRGGVVTLMIFVNDLAESSRIPGWLQHAGAGADAVTLPDVVLPAFLFIAGVSVPIALERARLAGATGFQLVRKILGRTFALVAAGILLGAIDEHDPYGGFWGVLAYAAVLLAFVAVPRQPGSRQRVWTLVRFTGWLAMLVLALLYKIPADASTPMPHHLLLGPLLNSAETAWLYPSGWGILGLIGWGYGATALAYLALGPRREWLFGITGLLLVLYVTADYDYLARLDARPWLEAGMPAITWVGAGLGWIDAQIPIREVLASSAAITLAGCCLGTVLRPDSDIARPADRMRWAAIYMAGLLVAAVVFDPPFGLNKEDATPAWGLLCAALTVGAWILLHAAVGRRANAGWLRFLQPAGANPLLAYLLHPFLCLLAAALALPIDFYLDPELPLAVHVTGSLIMALAIAQLTGLVSNWGFRIKA